MPNLNSLKIVSGGNISVDGYASVFEELIKDPLGFEAFCGDDSEDGFSSTKTALLLKAAKKTDPNIRITQRKENNNVESVDITNAKIRSKKDKRKESGKFSKVTVSMPEVAIEDPTELDYLDPFVQAYLNTIEDNPHTLTPSADPVKRNKARMYLFAAMLLTKCR